MDWAFTLIIFITQSKDSICKLYLPLWEYWVQRRIMKEPERVAEVALEGYMVGKDK